MSNKTLFKESFILYTKLVEIGSVIFIGVIFTRNFVFNERRREKTKGKRREKIKMKEISMCVSHTNEFVQNLELLV